MPQRYRTLRLKMVDTQFSEFEKTKKQACKLMNHKGCTSKKRKMQVH